MTLSEPVERLESPGEEKNRKELIRPMGWLIEIMPENPQACLGDE